MVNYLCNESKAISLPAGWRVPTDVDYQVFEAYIINNAHNGLVAKTNLMSRTTNKTWTCFEISENFVVPDFCGFYNVIINYGVKASSVIKGATDRGSIRFAKNND